MLVERESQLESLLSALEASRAGHGQIALVSGEAGIGKSTILSAFRVASISAYPDIRWCLGNCEALFTPRTLGPIFDMAPELGTGVIKALESEGGQAELYSAMLNALSDDAATVMVCEDVHWADHATLDLIKYLARRIQTLPVLLLLTFRNDEVNLQHPLTQVLGDLPGANTHRLQLSPLSEEAVTSLASARGREVGNLHKITNGNPFYVTELLASENKNDFVPASVKDAVALRLALLLPEEREILERLSVLPNAPEWTFLETLLGRDDIDLVNRCVTKGHLVEDGDYVRFRHELSRLATMDRLSPARRRSYHSDCVAALTKCPKRIPLAQTVHHAAGALDSEMVLQYAPLAARAAAIAGAHSEAAAHFATALKFIDSAEPELAAELYESWAYESALSDHFEDEVLNARRHAITLWRALERPDKVGHNLQQLSRLHWYRGESSEAARNADQAIRVLEAIPASSERAMAYSVRSQLHMLNDQMDDAVKWGHVALEIEAENPDPEVRMHAMNNIGTAMVFRNRSEGLKFLQNSLELALSGGHHEHAARAYNNMSEYAVEFRNFALAESILSDGLAFDTEHDLDAWSRYLSGRQAQLRLEQGRLNDAVSIAHGICSLDQHSLLSCLPARQVLAFAKMRRGDPDTETLMRDALADAIATDELQHIVPARLAIVEWAFLRNYPDQATEHMQKLLELSTFDRHPWNIGARTVWAHRLSVNDIEIDFDVIPLPHTLEIQGDYEGAARAWDRLGSPYEAALVRMMQGGTGPLNAALQAFTDMNAMAAAQKVQDLAEKTGIRIDAVNRKRGPYKAARTHPLGLTAKEQSVLRLLAEGRSNKEIAKSLNRSQRTVEHHVSSILGKLNAPNRMSAILRIQSEPWLIEPADAVV
ncbi:AAA family ATPase [Ponticaulis sp.]|uniref:helix-turn-helix transcriptional regulator n=1 Tax=Ponticaulis sp. TaxID=2020902 RepID=UPI000B62A63C|nr:AAA family ATPase [Ponticaulis sp.]MAI90392.1 LuxR family transcriptional regulator [Ponticaulis sp.]OUY00095.1 MAG: hypothetical protein CBB65_08130 [Hyphomonadaceae bacterium TMED5]|tara:strand:- start:6947 stop:9592 length:2646 start_codon:yes stop_codon:yes gene_type:complete